MGRIRFFTDGARLYFALIYQQINPAMKTHLLFLVFGFVFISFSCGNNSETNTEVSSNTTNNNPTANSDTPTGEESPQSTEEKVAVLVSETAKEFYEEWEKGDSIRDANEPHRWVFVIGDSYDDDYLAAQTYDQLKETEPDVFIFRKKRKKYYLIKGEGLSSRNILDDSLDAIQKRLNTRVDIIDLSKACRKMPTNTDDLKYKVEGEKRYARCKKCE